MRGNHPIETSPIEAERDQYERFVQLFARNEAGIRAFVWSLLPVAHHTDEVVQETSLVLWRKFSDYQTGTDFLSWALTIARFEVLKYRRNLARDRHVFDPEVLAMLADEAAAETGRLAQERGALADCVERLPAKQRELIRASYAQGVTICQVAEKLGRSATSLYKALNRIRGVLLDCIQTSLAREGQS